MRPLTEAFLVLYTTILLRDEEATRQALRWIAITLSDKDAHRTVELVHRSITSGARQWLRRLA